MRYLLLFLLLALQTSVFGYSTNNQYKNDDQKVLISVKSNLNARSNIDFLYQGQYLDTETELAYNRFRYYSPESGMYISQDPIGLAGGMPNSYAYVPSSSTELDVLGLSYGSWNDFQSGMGGTFNNDNQMPWNKPPSNSADSAEGWKWYQATNTGTDELVIGRLDDTGKFKGKAGYNVLDSGRWSPGVNKSWVQGGIDRGATFKMVSPRTTANLWDAKRGAPTVFAEELDQLKKAGYIEKDGKMIPGPKMCS